MSTYVSGVDIGSTTAKCIIIDDKKKIVGKSLFPVGVRIVEDAEKAFQLALEDAKLEREQVKFITGTGYGRFKVHFGQGIVTEISCHAKGAQFLFPNTQTVLDIGGQDTKAIRVKDGEIIDFAMNDKCSAGTGRFLEVCADALDFKVSEIGELSLKGDKPVKISSTCTVFAESEVINQVSRGKTPENILAGMHLSIARRSVSLMRRVGIVPEITFTGGVSRNRGLVASLEEVLETKINVSPVSQYLGACGAALFGLERILNPNNDKIVQQELMVE